jgi:branched-chain amino acid aminotransferase
MSTQMKESDWIWRDGEFVRWQDAQIHVLSLAVQFGSSVFEGMRCYSTPDGPAIFRLRDHLERLVDSARVYRMEPAHSVDELMRICCEAVERNSLDSCYIRPMVLRGYGAAGMNPIGSPVQTFIPCWPWGSYLGEAALEQGVDVGVSSWQRAEPNTFPSTVKAAGNYNNAQLIKMEAVSNGFAEAIALGPGGLVSEGSGQNLFLVRRGVLITPQLDGTMLNGITRDSILAIAREMDIPVREQPVARESLYGADELFLCGTATEIVPVRTVDRIRIGAGKAGPLTRRLQKRFLAIVGGREAPPAGCEGWLTFTRQAVVAHR